jgi:hypothetical protein
MPLPRTERQIELLTQGWPGGPEDFELAAFAAAFRCDRPELSAPALDRIGLLVEKELSRLERSGARGRAARAIAPRLGRYVPIAAAAAVALAVGIWCYSKAGPSNPGSSTRSLPVIHSQPAARPDEPAAPGAFKPVTN